MRIIRPSEVKFADDRIEKQFNALGENDEVKKWIKRAIGDIKKNAFCAIPIPKKIIPFEYIQKYGIRNLWKYDLPDGWRLMYSVTTPQKLRLSLLFSNGLTTKNTRGGSGIKPTTTTSTPPARAQRQVPPVPSCHLSQ